MWVLLVAAWTSACTASDSSVRDEQTADDPPSDSADTSCRVILRYAEIAFENSDGSGAPTGHRVSLDVDSQLVDSGHEVGLRYAIGGGDWQEITVDHEAERGPSGLSRYDALIPAIQTDLTIEVIPFTQAPGGNRMFDHNRRSSEFDNYQLTPPRYQIERDDTLCPSPEERDQSCRIILRYAETAIEANSGSSAPIGYRASIDVSSKLADAGHRVGVKYAIDGGDWRLAMVDSETERYDSGFSRFGPLIPRGSHMEQRVRFRPFLLTPDGRWLTDHNRPKVAEDPSADDDDYILKREDTFRVERAEEFCQTTEP